MHERCSLSLALIPFYCHSMNVKQIEMFKSLLPVFGFLKMAKKVFFYFKWNFTLLAQIGLCTKLYEQKFECVHVWCA